VPHNLLLLLAEITQDVHIAPDTFVHLRYRGSGDGNGDRISSEWVKVGLRLHSEGEVKRLAAPEQAIEIRG